MVYSNGKSTQSQPVDAEFFHQQDLKTNGIVDTVRAILYSRDKRDLLISDNRD